MTITIKKINSYQEQVAWQRRFMNAYDGSTSGGKDRKEFLETLLVCKNIFQFYKAIDNKVPVGFVRLTDYSDKLGCWCISDGYVRPDANKNKGYLRHMIQYSKKIHNDKICSLVSREVLNRHLKYYIHNGFTNLTPMLGEPVSSSKIQLVFILTKEAVAEAKNNNRRIYDITDSLDLKTIFPHHPRPAANQSLFNKAA